MGTTKKIGDEEIREDFGDGDKLIKSFRGIVINRIIDVIRRGTISVFIKWL